MIKIKKGLDLPITGAPVQEISASPEISSCAVLGHDYVGLKPTMAVKEGDSVKAGQLLFTDKKNISSRIVAPISGIVSAINRGNKRILLSVVIDGDGQNNYQSFDAFQSSPIGSMSSEQAKALLIESGLWASLRTRPFGKVPLLEKEPKAIFVTAIDTHPLAVDPSVVIQDRLQDYTLGLEVITKLTPGKIFHCGASNTPKVEVSGIEQALFEGPHPAGLPGTHIHFLSPVSENTQVWYINYQDVIAIGELFSTGKYNSTRVVALAGPQVQKPRLVRVPIGAALDAITTGQTKSGENRIISGSVFGGVSGMGVKAYLGRYHLQVSVLLEGRERGFIEYLSTGKDKHSVARIYLSQFAKAMKFPMTTTTNGSERAMVPIGLYEKVVPLDILPTQLLRSLIVGDIESAIELGALELEEEDLALSTYVCPGKYEYGPILRTNLTRIEQEG